jgi:NAD(P)-dependent dehydrogenase (short-subunit alcohol dehydrogenase family)
MCSHDVIGVVRSEEKGNDLVEFLGGKGTGASFIVCDLMSRSQIADPPLQLQFEGNPKPIHCLINNAAIVPPERLESKDTGEELQWCVNVLSYHRVTKSLLPQMSKAAGARVVWVASTYAGSLNMNDPQFTRRMYDPAVAYMQSKQANRMLVRVWSEKLKASHPNVSIVACHPGVAMSNVWDVWVPRMGTGSTPVGSGHGESKTLYFCATGNIQSGKFYTSTGGTSVQFLKDKRGLTRLWNIVEKSH